MRKVGLLFLGICMVGSSIALADPYQPGDYVADFTLNDAQGSPVSLSDFDGHVVVINWWANT